MNNSDDPNSICSQHTEQIEVAGLPVTVVRQSITTLKLGFFPPEGRLRVDAPLHTDDDTLRQAVIARLDWIREQQAGYAKPAADNAAPEMLSGEQHWFMGTRYPLQVIEQTEIPASITLLPDNGNEPAHMRLFTPPGSSRAERLERLEQWYQSQLGERLPALLQRWQDLIGKQPIHCGIKAMSTRWGSCNPRSRRIWLNTALAQKPADCLEFILVHELVHLRERRHGQHFDALLEQFLPDWQQRRNLLEQAPASHPDWTY